jgi:aminopeptidase N
LEPEDKKWNLPTGYTFQQTFDCWVRQMGYPVVTVRYEEGQMVLSQERYLHNEPESQLDKPASSFAYKWNVPVSYLDDKNAEKLAWLLDSGEELTLPVDNGQILWLDPEAQTLIRINYGSYDNVKKVILNHSPRPLIKTYFWPKKVS